VNTLKNCLQYEKFHWNKCKTKSSNQQIPRQCCTQINLCRLRRSSCRSDR